MKLSINDLQPNPFKKWINNGELVESRIQVMCESINHGTLPETFSVRNNGNGWEIPFGHHRLEALKRIKGEDYKVEVIKVDFSDEQMLVDMIRENLTQRDTDYRDFADSALLAKRWLETKADSVKELNALVKKGGHFQGIGARQIADFLSHEGKAISHTQISKYLKIEEEGTPELKEKATKGTQGHTEPKKLGLELSAKIASFPKEEQNTLIKIAEETELSEEKIIKLLTKYKETSEEIKQQILNKEINITDIEDAIENQEVKEFRNKHPRFVFIPNFAGRIREFNKDILRLEKQIKAFGLIFKDSKFQDNYISLETKQKSKLNTVISDFTERINKCNQEISFFNSLLNKELTEGK